ncbi:MAG: hypothetical protein KIS63_05710 [Caldilineales bacterium]|nr:hypothetical protein [Caldilineales bacterium]
MWPKPTAPSAVAAAITTTPMIGAAEAMTPTSAGAFHTADGDKRPPQLSGKPGPANSGRRQY